MRRTHESMHTIETLPKGQTVLPIPVGIPRALEGNQSTNKQQKKRKQRKQGSSLGDQRGKNSL